MFQISPVSGVSVDAVPASSPNIAQHQVDLGVLGHAVNSRTAENFPSIDYQSEYSDLGPIWLMYSPTSSSAETSDSFALDYEVRGFNASLLPKF